MPLYVERIVGRVSRMHHECLIDPNHAERCQYQPDYDDYRGCNPADGFFILDGLLHHPRSALHQNLMGDQLYSQGDAYWYQDEVIYKAKNRHKVWDQINRAEGIGDDASNEKLRIPRCSGVACSKVKSKGLRLEMSRTLFQFCEQCHIVISGRPTACLSSDPDLKKATHDTL